MPINYDPPEINNLFQPPESSVENIISTVLGSDQRPVEQSGVERQAPTTGQVQYWTGYWTQYCHKGIMKVELFFAANHKIVGGGSDKLGLFTCKGECRGTRVHFIKQYIGKHKVEYDGEIRNNVMNGTWKIGVFGRGKFHLEQQSYQSVANGAKAGILQVGVMQHWKGFYIQGHEKGHMSGDILFTNTNNIYGSGVDEVGGFTWLGRFQQESHYASVTMTKQYDGKHAVLYMGAISHSLETGHEEPKVVMEGSWGLSDNSNHGPFILEPEVHS